MSSGSQSSDVNSAGKGVAALLSGVLIGGAVSCIAFIACALALTYTGMGEGAVGIVVPAAGVASCLIAGFDAGKGASGRGWLWGMAAGGVYAALFVIIGVTVAKGFSLNAKTLTLALMCVAGGGLGGVIGINFRK